MPQQAVSDRTANRHRHTVRLIVIAACICTLVYGIVAFSSSSNSSSLIHSHTLAAVESITSHSHRALTQSDSAHPLNQTRKNITQPEIVPIAVTELSQRSSKKEEEDKKKSKSKGRDKDRHRKHSGKDEEKEKFDPSSDKRQDLTVGHGRSRGQKSDRKENRGSNDENVLDESHQRTIVDMYGRHTENSHWSGTKGLGRSDPSTSPDLIDPYEFPGMYPNEGPDEWDYAITIDCGSKGSRVHIYKFQHRHSPSSIPPFSPLFTKHAWFQDASPGISSYVDRPELAIAPLKRLLEFAENSLSAFRYKWNRTPVYLKATAGMRLIKNLPSRDRIMETIRNFLSDRSKNPFYFERTMARVISGEEEGVYGWITVNYLSGTLMHASSQTAYGALDMGGASTQITFRPPFDVLSNYFPLRIQQERIRLYTHSFLNFGMERALQRVNDRLIEAANGTITNRDGSISKSPTGPTFITIRNGVRVFRHPCFPFGFSFTYLYVDNLDLGASYTGRSTYGDDEKDGADLSPITTYSEKNSKREMVQFEGSQDFGNCSAITWQLLHKKGACFDNTCSFNGIYQPRFGNTTFLAFSKFAKVVTGDLELPRNATLKEIDLKTRVICGWNWQTLQDTYRYAKIDNLSKLCFNARYIFTVLYKGFGFPYEGQNIIFVRNILDLGISWALGSTLYEANAMPWDIDQRKVDEEKMIDSRPAGRDRGSDEEDEQNSRRRSNGHYGGRHEHTDEPKDSPKPSDTASSSTKSNSHSDGASASKKSDEGDDDTDRNDSSTTHSADQSATESKLTESVPMWGIVGVRRIIDTQIYRIHNCLHNPALYPSVF